ncbi:hypothetical protein [Nocardia sp. NPDC057353]|uniref:hypothetical protein n=1 Tax=Nocardia sp. NPDC057353 TaxID=3346104 RepID=UPI003629D408
MSDPVPPATTKPRPGGENDPRFWRQTVLATIALFLLGYLWFLAVWNMLGVDRYFLAVAIAAGSTLVPPLALAPIRHRRRGRALFAAAAAVIVTWLVALFVIAVLIVRASGPP